MNLENIDLNANITYNIKKFDLDLVNDETKKIVEGNKENNEFIKDILDEDNKKLEDNEAIEDNKNLEDVKTIDYEKNIEDDIIEEIKIDYDTLVLAGGSSKGIVTLGALQYAYDNYLIKNVNKYVGTSSGAMISFLLAIGYTPIEIITYICCNQLLEKILHFNIVAMINGEGASSFTNIYESFEKMTIEKIGFLPTFRDLKERFGKTLVFVTYNITENKAEYLSYETYPNLPCLIAIRMSANLPLIFEKYKYGNSYYIDGGVCDNFAIDIGDKIGNKILGIVLNSRKEDFSNEPDMNILEYIYKIMFIPVSQILEYKLKNISDKCKIVNLDYNKIKFFNFDINSKEKLEMFSSGYMQMKKQFENI
jgi:predicted acylesterase/phospholipase RssA